MLRYNNSSNQSITIMNYYSKKVLNIFFQYLSLVEMRVFTVLTDSGHRLTLNASDMATNGAIDEHPDNTKLKKVLNVVDII